MSSDNKVPSVKAFMSQVLFTLPDDTTLRDAAQFFTWHKLTTIPVTNAKGDIAGVLSDFHLLRALLKSRSNESAVCLRDITDELDPVITIHEDESIVSAFRLMVQSPNHRIYAVHGDKLCGALSPKDLLLYMAGVKDKNDKVLNEIVQKQIESMIKELHETRRKLSEYQRMFHDSPYLMHSIDLNGKIIAANRMLHFVLGYDENFLIGKSFRFLYPPENHKAAIEGLDTVLKLGFHPLINVPMIKQDATLVRVDIASTVKTDDTGTPIGTITVGRLSDSHRMINYLQRAARLASVKKTQKAKKAAG